MKASLLAGRVAAFGAERSRASALRCPEHEWTWSELAASADRLASELARLGVPERSFVVIAAAHSAMVPLAMTGVAARGAIPAVVDGRDPARVAAAIESLSPSALVAAGARTVVDFRGPVVALNATAAGLEFASTGSAGRGAVASAPAGAGLVVFSSGTSAAPKAIVWSEARLAALREGDVPRSVGEEPCAAVIRSMGAAGDALMAAACLIGGRAIAVIGPMLAVAPAYAAMDALRVGRFVCTPPQVELMLNSRLPLPRPVRALRVTGAALPPERLLALRELAGPVAVSKSYGLAEAGVVALLEASELARKPASSGRLLPGRAIAIERTDRSAAAPGEEGTVAIRLAVHTTADGYWRADPGLAGSFEGGLVRPGDRGFVDSEGFLTIVSRPTELLKVAGQSVSAVHVERALALEAPGFELAVVGVPHARDGEVPAVIYVPRGEPGEAEVLRRAAARALRGADLPRWFLPRHELPTTSSGKLDRVALAREATAYAEIWTEAVATHHRLWPAWPISQELWLVDDLAPQTSAAPRSGARMIAAIAPHAPERPLGWTSIEDASGVRVLEPGGFQRGAVSSRPAVAALSGAREVALRLPGPPASAVIAVPGTAETEHLLRLAGFGTVHGVAPLLGWTPSGAPPGVELTAKVVALAGRQPR